MTRRVCFRAALLLLCATALAFAYHQAKTEAMMVDVATRFIDSLDKFQKGSTVFKFDTVDRDSTVFWSLLTSPKAASPRNTAIRAMA